jgi:hypothetical protein
MNKLNNIIRIMLIAAFVSAAFATDAREMVGIPKDPTSSGNNPGGILMKSGCKPATALRDLDLNNVRTTILNGGDMWWNLRNARYEIPKVGAGQVAKHSLFAGALWIGGVTNNNLRLAAQTYRQRGNDFYPGPLTIGAASITPDRCLAFDYIAKVTLLEIDAFRNGGDYSNPSEDFTNWPQGDPSRGEERNIAPYFDNDGDNIYNPLAGDYPSFEPNNPRNIPDMMLFVLYNDKGNIHSETEGLPIGLELHTTCFAYATNDAINNMTFYRTIVINRGNETIDSCVFGQWVDPDLGNYADDYVECDVNRNLGICYNGDDNDEGVLGYGLNPPSVGVNFFEGPRREDGTEIGLTKFVYYNNDFSVQGNPRRPEHFWGYLNGRWTDGAPITYGGQGRGGGPQDTASFMFPGFTDPAGRSEWTERTAGNPPADRRFLQTAGSFTLLPGATNRVIIAVVWARASSGGATGSFNLLKQASDQAFTLFRNNFALIAGPDAPVISGVELNRRIILNLVNTDTVEAFVDSFAGPCDQRSVFKFQGYQIYQLKIPNVPNDINNEDEARLLAQFDIQDGVARLVNEIYDPVLEENVKRIMVEGLDNGIVHSLEVSKDLFETGSDQELVNFKNYHYLIIAYAYNSTCVSDATQYLAGRKTVGRRDLSVYTFTPRPRNLLNSGADINAKYGDGFLVTQVEGIGNGGLRLELTDESVATLLKKENNYVAKNRTYKPGFGPINVKVIDPLVLPQGEFHLYLRDLSNNTKMDSMLNANETFWFLKNIATGEVVRGTRALSSKSEQVFTRWGISVQIEQALMPGDVDNQSDLSNGFITSSIEFQVPSNDWLSGVIDEDPRFSSAFAPQFNWIRSGNAGSTRNPAFSSGEEDDFGLNNRSMDPRRNFSNIINSRWAPYALSARWRSVQPNRLPTFGPAWDLANTNGPGQSASPSNGVASFDNTLADLHGIDVVFTNDRSLWSRCIVVETGDFSNLNQGQVDKMDLRRAASVDKFGRKVGDPGAINDPTNPEAANYVADSGMSWFPGYAIDVETGERLNIFFGEDSSLPTENGSDMIWNPTNNILDRVTFRPVFGGKHYIYVSSSSKNITFGSGASGFRLIKSRYDEGRAAACILSSNCRDFIQSPTNPTYFVRKRMFYSQIMWTSMAMLRDGASLSSMQAGLVPNEAKIRIRVKRPYATHSHDTSANINDGMPYFRFTTEGRAPVFSKEAGRKFLDNVAVVPNPYYAYSAFEDPGNQLSNLVRIVNLPPRCVIKIYTLDGVLVRTIRKDDPNAPYITWDITNDANVPVASGMYLIHINATDLGEERIIKWFGIMRAADYDSF